VRRCHLPREKAGRRRAISVMRSTLEDGSEAAEAEYAVMIRPDEIVWLNGGKKAHVLDVVPVEEEDSPYVGLLKVAAA
jgi:hypothetical protein